MMGIKQRCCRIGKGRPARIAVKIDGRIVRKMLLQLVVESMISETASGASSMVALFDEIHAKVIPTQEKLEGGFFLIPAALSPEEYIAKEEARNANAQDPTTYVNYKAEEMCKAAKGIDSPLGEALLAFHKRWG
jgi:hypothetical protein